MAYRKVSKIAISFALYDTYGKGDRELGDSAG